MVGISSNPQYTKNPSLTDHTLGGDNEGGDEYWPQGEGVGKGPQAKAAVNERRGAGVGKRRKDARKN